MQFNSTIHDSSEGVLWVRDTSCNRRDMGMVVFWGLQWLSRGLFQYSPALKIFSMERNEETETVRKKDVRERRERTLGNQMMNHHCSAWSGGN